MEGNSIIGMAGGFIALAIMLGIGTLVLGGASIDCTTTSDWNSTTPSAADIENGTTVTYNDQVWGAQTGWANQCLTNDSQSQSGYGLLMVSLIVLAAAVVLIVVRMLSG